MMRPVSLATEVSIFARRKPVILYRRPVVEPIEGRLLLTALPGGFSESVVASGIGDVTAMDVLKDGRVLISTQEGAMRIVDNGVLQPTPVFSIPVDSSGERGLLGVVDDPNFASNHFIYAYHTVPASGSAAPFNEVSRFTMQGDVAVAGSQLDILRLNDLNATNHNGGSLHFGTDGYLYIGVGENANPANSQTLSNLLGKVLRINVAQSSPGDPINDVAKLIPPGNPFVGQATGINQAIYALGFRNPYTFAVQPTTGTIFINDVGLSTWEEIDKLVPGGNYGWNLSEGFANPAPPAGLGPGLYQDPLMAYNHTGGPAGGGVAITGGVFYDPPAGATQPFPASYIGKYFYQDLGEGFIRLFDPSHPGALANPDPSSAFATQAVAGQVDLRVSPTGGLYYLTRGNGGQLLEVSYNQAAAPTVLAQPAALTVAPSQRASFTVSAGGAGGFSYQWQRSTDGGASFTDLPHATAASFTLNHPKRRDHGSLYRVVITNSDGSVTSDSAALTVVNSKPPTPKILFNAGLRNGRFDAGQSIMFSLAASDPRDGAEGASQFTVGIDLLTGTRSPRTESVQTFVPAASGSLVYAFTPEATGAYTAADVLYRITITVTDSLGLSRTITRDLRPNIVDVRLKSTPVRAMLQFDGAVVNANRAIPSVVGFMHALDAPATTTADGRTYTFANWSNGGNAMQTITTPPVRETLVARYAAG